MMISHGILDVSTGLDLPAQSSVLSGAKLDTQDCESNNIIRLTSNERQTQLLYYFSKSDNKCEHKPLINSYQKYKIRAHRPSIQGTKPLFLGIKAIIIISNREYSTGWLRDRTSSFYHFLAKLPLDHLQ